MAQAYEYLARWFEYLNDDCGYEQWSQYFIEELGKLGVGRKGLEVGCGSGYFCRALTKAGYCMTGADISVPMLSKAAELAAEEGLKISYVQADAAALKSPEKFDFILAPNDCYNYIPQGKLLQAFRHAAACLTRGGIFWADISSSYKLRHKVANNSMADDRDEVTYLAFNTLKGDSVQLDVTLFCRQKDGSYLRYDEQHTQYIHETADVVTALEKAGFEVLSSKGHLGREDGDRIDFICRKR